LGGLLQRPAASGLELEDGHPLGGPVVRSAMGWDLRHAKLMDAEFLAQQGDLLMVTVEFGLESDARIRAVGGPAAGVGESELGQADDVQDSGLDVSVPAAWYGNIR
jgi:hypothetical protein